MIVITRLNGTQFAINPDLIERCYASPDTHVTMVEGTTYIITETVDELIELIATYRAHVLKLAFGDNSVESGQRLLSLVPATSSIRTNWPQPPSPGK